MFKSKKHLIGMVTAALLCTSAVAQTDPSTTPPPATTAPAGDSSVTQMQPDMQPFQSPAGQVGTATSFGLTDKSFVTRLAQGNNYEIAAAQLALSKASAPEIKTYAQMMITDHTAMGQKLSAAVNTISPKYSLPLSISPKHQLMLSRLQAATTDFDAEYRRQMLASHQETLEFLNIYLANKYGNLTLKGTANLAVPVVSMHLQMAQGLPASASSSTPATATPAGTTPAQTPPATGTDSGTR